MESYEWILYRVVLDFQFIILSNKIEETTSYLRFFNICFKNLVKKYKKEEEF